jgi:hypothetical protein
MALRFDLSLDSDPTYRLTRKDGAPGIDGVMADAYARNLEANLLDLLDRIKTGRPSRY